VNDVADCGVRSYLGGSVEFTALATVLREIPSRSAIRAFGTPSAANLRINAQSSKVITLPVSSAHFSPGRTAQFSAVIDSIYWSTRQRLDGYPTRPSLSRALRIGRGWSVAGAWLLTIVPVLALINPRAIGRRMLALVGAVIAVNWVFYCVIFLGVSRYRYLPDAFLCLPTAAVIGLIWQAGRNASSTAASPT
jgi:hypothetical protein